MLGKLIKHDIRSTWRDFVAIYVCILLGVLIIPQLFMNINNEMVMVIGGFIAIGIAVATLVVMIAMLFKIYNKNVFSKEGYLTMTLPVSSSQIVLSKLLVSSMWIVLTVIVGAIGLFIFILNVRAGSLEGVFDPIRLFLSAIGNNGRLAVALVVVSGILSIIKEIAKIFLACSIAHLKQLNRFRIPAGILSYFVFTWLEVVIVQGVMYIAGKFPYMDEIIQRMNQMNQMADPRSFLQFTDLLNGTMVVGIFYSLILTVAFAFGTNWILKNKLDLD